MRDAFYRLTSPILDRIPDITHQPKSRQVSIGLAASLLFHLLLLLFALGVGGILPTHALMNFAKPKPKLEEIELTIIPPEPEIQTIRDPAKPFIDSAGLAPSDRPNEKALFESDRDMVAASAVPARGVLPLPSQNGLSLPDVEMFANQEMRLGKGSTPFPGEVSLDPAKPPAPEPATAEKPPPPNPLPEVDKPSENQIAIITKTAPLTKPKLRTGASTHDLPSSPAASDFQREEEKTQTEGSISELGPNSVNAAATPEGVYIANVERMLYSRWIGYKHAKADLIAPGSVLVHFSIEANGRVTNVRSEQNTSTATYATICENAARDSEVPPLPPAVLDSQLEDRLDMSIRFINATRSSY